MFGKVMCNHNNYKKPVPAWQWSITGWFVIPF